MAITWREHLAETRRKTEFIGKPLGVVMKAASKTWKKGEGVKGGKTKRKGKKGKKSM